MAASDRSVAVLHPDWVLHPTRYTGTKTVQTLTVGSSERVSWLCSEGEDHLWKGTVSNRHAGQSVCQTCKESRNASNSVAALHPDWVLHPTRYTGAKTVQTLTVGGSRERVSWLCPEGEDHIWEGVVSTRHTRRSVCQTCKESRNASNSVAALHLDWVLHPTRYTGTKTVQTLTVGSKQRVSWLCPEGEDHLWEGRVCDRHAGKSACQTCQDERDTSNSVAALHPDWALHPTQYTGTKTVQTLTVGSSERVAWLCPESEDHVWRGTFGKRHKGQSSCQTCKEIRNAANSVAALHPDWVLHPTRYTGTKTVQTLTVGSKQRVSWLCSEGEDHLWDGVIIYRHKGRSSCQTCQEERDTANSVATLHPDWALHPTRYTGTKTVQSLTVGSDERVSWLCPQGEDHHWVGRVSVRHKGWLACQTCQEERDTANSVATLHPDWVLHPTRYTGTKTVQTLTVGSSERVSWLCPQGEGHAWEGTVVDRHRQKSACQTCQEERDAANSVATIHPDWKLHPTRYTGAKTVQTLTVGNSTERVSWLCPEGEKHVWEGSIVARHWGRSGCRTCRQVRDTANSVAVLHPSWALHPTLYTGTKTVQTLTVGSGDRVSWLCPQGEDHLWEGSVVNRHKGGSVCRTCSSRWTREKVRDFVEGLRGDLASLSAVEAWVIFEQSGLAASTTAMRDPFLRRMRAGSVSLAEVDEWLAAGPASGDEGDDDALLGQDLGTAAEGGAVDGDGGSDDTLGALDVEDLDALADRLADPLDGLPVVSAEAALTALDSAVRVSSADEEAVEFFVASAKGKLWKAAYLDPAAAREQAEGFDGGERAVVTRDRFLAELDAAQGLVVPAGWAFPKGQPNLMQRHIASQVATRRRVGNWSGTGAGKTLSAVLASRVIDAGLTVIVCPDAVVGEVGSGENDGSGWAGVITSAYPGVQVATRTFTPTWTHGTSRPRYLVVNYDKFRDAKEGAVAEFLAGERIDMVVIDEVHFAKQRDAAAEVSQRKRLLGALIGEAAQRNPDLAVLGMSATPVINSLREGVSLIELITGEDHSDLDTKSSVPACVALHRRLVLLGTRWMPSYEAALVHSEPVVDCTDVLDDVRALGAKPHPAAVEVALMRAKIPTIVAACSDGRPTLVYTEYVTGIVPMLVEALTAAGLRVGLAIGEDDSGLAPFLRGAIDVLIGSSAVGTGVDGIQDRCARLVFASLPWTAAGFEQVIGRVNRTGQGASQVEVITPLTAATIASEEWSWCRSRWRRIEWKQSVADAAVDGVLPQGSALIGEDQTAAALVGWLERLDQDGMTHTHREALPVIPLAAAPSVPVEQAADEQPTAGRPAGYGQFSAMNSTWNTTASARLHARLIQNPDEWHRYHDLYRAARASWEFVPMDYYAEHLVKRRSCVIGDFGAGDALLGERLSDRHTVHSFDHVAANDRVVACDMASTGLPDASLDVAVFSLALMGADPCAYLREAHRTLGVAGDLYIAEATSRFHGREREFERALAALGFDGAYSEQRGQFTLIRAKKADRLPGAGPVWQFTSASPSSATEEGQAEFRPPIAA